MKIIISPVYPMDEEFRPLKSTQLNMGSFADNYFELTLLTAENWTYFTIINA